ncbi:MAG TPA: GYD domain-containing protein [Actinomycetota bacterium]|nr:GYD domain-containing protein [Actinomycetota bacterium]
MAKYMIQASYTQSGVQGVLKEGGSGRRDAIGKLLADLGGSLEGFYFAFGQDDVFVIADLPDNVTAAAIGLTVAASGAVTSRTVVLLTPEEIDRATQQSVSYRAPGA